MKDKIWIGLLTLVWLVLMGNIIWEGTQGQWRILDAEKIGNLEVAKYTDQLIVVAVSEEGTMLSLYERSGAKNSFEESEDEGAALSLKEKKRPGGTEWKLILETPAMIGKNGLGKTKEGDGKTPSGVFSFVKAFGILENPGTELEYTQVDESHYWVDDGNSKYYNQFVSVREVTPDWTSAEHIVEYEECYRYVLATSYNVERIRGKGSAVFLHCTSDQGEGTAGCIAVPEVYMREIMKRIKQQCILVIDEREKIVLY